LKKAKQYDSTARKAFLSGFEEYGASLENVVETPTRLLRCLQMYTGEILPQSESAGSIAMQGQTYHSINALLEAANQMRFTQISPADRSQPVELTRVGQLQPTDAASSSWSDDLLNETHSSWGSGNWLFDAYPDIQAPLQGI